MRYVLPILPLLVLACSPPPRPGVESPPYQSVVRTECRDSFGRPVARASAVVVRSRTLGLDLWELTLLTAGHAIPGPGESLFVQLFRAPNLGRDQEVATVPARVLGSHALHDAAVIQCVSPIAIRAIDLSNRIEIGDEITATGFALGNHLVLAKGLVSSHETSEGRWPELWVGSCYCQHGMSGGPVLDIYGRVVGIVSAKYGRTEGILLFTPVSVLSPWLKSWL